MEMDLQMSLIAIGVACATAVAVYFVSVIGIREKSFEEAIAEQKKRSDDLLGHHNHKKDKKKVGGKEKSSSKKLKKREKQNNNVVISSDLSDAGEAPPAVVVEDVVEQKKVENVATSAPHVPERRSDKKSHVEIVDEPEIMEDEDDEEQEGKNDNDDERVALPKASSRRSSVSTTIRRDSIIKPILLNKDESPVVSLRQEVEPANNFEQIHPKDDCELKKDRCTESSAAAENASTPPSPLVSANKSSGGSNTPENEVVVTDSPNVSKRTNSRNKRSGKGEDDPTMTAPKMEKLIDKLPLTSSEIQSLIDVLLNKQHAGDSEWVQNTKGGNSVGELKKQIESKDKLIEEEKESVRGLQDKLKVLRNEFSGEKSKFAGVRRNLEEQVHNKNAEMQNLQMRLRQVGEIGMNEKQELQKQLTRMQVKFKDVQDEYEAIKADYRNYRDAEQSIRSKADTLERESGALKTQCGHLENQLKAAFSSNQEMSNQLCSLQDRLRQTEERKKEAELVMNSEYRKVQDREAVLLNELATLKNTISGAENENATLRNKVNTLETSVKGLDEVNGKYEEVRKSEVGLKNVVNELKSNVSNLEEVAKEKQTRIADLERQVDALKGEVKDMQDKGVANGEVREEEVLLLGSQLSELRNHVVTLTTEVDSVRQKNDELRHKNQNLVEFLNVTEKSLQSKMEGHAKLEALDKERQTRASAIVTEIVGKPVDLSSEDWITESLTTVRGRVKELDSAVAKATAEAAAAKATAEAEKAKAEAAKADAAKATEAAKAEAAKAADAAKATEAAKAEAAKAAAAVAAAAAAVPPPPPETVKSSNDEEVAELTRRGKELEDEVTHYQGLLKQTETLLSNLQASINDEEAKWVSQTADKDKEIARLNAQTTLVDDLRAKCAELEKAGEDSKTSSSTTIDELKSSNAHLRESCDKLTVLTEELKSKLASANERLTTIESHNPTTNGSISNGDDQTLNRSINNNATTTSTPGTPPSTPGSQHHQTAPAPSSPPPNQQPPLSPPPLTTPTSPPPATTTASSSPPVNKEKKKKKGAAKKQTQ